MLLKVSSGGPPPGNYNAIFDGVEATSNDKYGAGLRWKFRIPHGPQAGQIASRITGTAPTAKNGCGKMLSGLLGRELRVDEEIDPQQFVGKLFLIVVATAEGGGTRVEAIVATSTVV